jgi:hypothetical protein
VLTVRLEAAETLAAERLDRVRFLERELERRSDELGALRLELSMLREVSSGPRARCRVDPSWMTPPDGSRTGVIHMRVHVLNGK